MGPSAVYRPSGQQPISVGVLRGLMVFDTAALLFAGIVHLVGARIPLGVGTFVEPPLLPAGVVETLLGVVFAIAAYYAVRGLEHAWGWALGAHLGAIAGFIVGLYATSDGTTVFNHDYHVTMLAVFAVGLLLLLFPEARDGLGYGDR